MSSMGHYGMFSVSMELLKEILHLPDEAKIITVWSNTNRPWEVNIIVDSPDLPLVDTTKLPPIYHPILHTISMEPTTIVWDWNLPKNKDVP